ncbi:MAG: hypothetical protein VKI83_00635 [Synechococcaceae cyanobacterium]|nr:hypothetical protein [Synechococcaceae cyanobacterium]
MDNASESWQEPALALRRRLTEANGRLLVIVATTVVWVLDTLLVERLKQHHVVAQSFDPLLDSFERLSTVVFVVVCSAGRWCIWCWRWCRWWPMWWAW